MPEIEIDKNLDETLQKERERLQNQLVKVYKREIDKLPELKIDDFSKDNTALIIVDMIEGFTRIGNLKSPRIEGKISHIAEIAAKCKKAGIKTIAFADEHGEDSPEFKTYGPHCIKGSKECEVVQEIREAAGAGMLRIAKNSNNGFLEEEFQQWLKANKDIKNFIVVGDCTDICVSAFSESIRSYLDRENIMNGRVLIPESAVATYDAPWHNGDFKHYDSLINMKERGVEIFSKITF